MHFDALEDDPALVASESDRVEGRGPLKTSLRPPRTSLHHTPEAAAKTQQEGNCYRIHTVSDLLVSTENDRHL